MSEQLVEFKYEVLQDRLDYESYSTSTVISISVSVVKWEKGHALNNMYCTSNSMVLYSA